MLLSKIITFMYDHMSHHRRNRFCHYCLETFSTAEILKSHVNDCFKINGKQMIKNSKRVNILDSKIMERK